MIRAVVVCLLLLPANSFSQRISWIATNGPPGVSIRSFVVHPEGYVLAGTANHYIYRRSNTDGKWEQRSSGLLANYIYDLAVDNEGRPLACGYGVYRSSDGGRTWNFLGPQDGIMTIVSDSDGHLYAGAWSSVYRSTDDGLTWEQLINGLPTAWVEHLFVDRNDHLFAGTTFGVLRSTDGGDTWISIGPPGAPTNGFYLTGMDMNQYGWILLSGLHEGVYITRDEGSTWSYLFGAGRFISAVSFDSSDGLLAGNKSGEVLRSSDRGNTWRHLNPGYWFSEVSSFGLNASNEIFVGTVNGGIFQTNDLGQSWTQTNTGLEEANTYMVKTNSRGDLFARTRNFIYRSTNQGEMWMPTNFGDDAEAGFAIAPNDDIFASTSFLPGARSTDCGATWTNIFNGVCCYISSFGFGLDGSVLAVAGDLYRSTDNGDSWQMQSDVDNLISLAVAPTGSLFGGTIFGGILRSTNNGLTWDSVGAGVPWRPLSSTLVNSNGDVFLGGRDGGGLFRSTDNGNTWIRLKIGLTDSSIHSIAQDSMGDLFVVTGSQGVFRSSNNGNEWIEENAGIPTTILNDLISDSDGGLYVGGEAGVFRGLISTSTPGGKTTLPTELRLEQNYPNPFNPTTTIRFVLPRSGFVTIKLYDLLGRELRTLIHETKNAGEHSVALDASGLASGILFYSLQYERKLRTRRMVLLQ